MVTAGNTAIIGEGTTVTVDAQTASAGTLSFKIDNGTSGSFTTTTGAIDITGTTMAATIGANVTDGEEYLVMDGTSAIVGGPGSTLTAVQGSYLWGVNMIDGTGAAAATDNTELYYQTVQANTVAGSVTNSNNAVMGDVLLSLTTTTDAEITQVIEAMNNAQTQDALNEVIEAAQPTADGGHVVGSLTFMNSSMGIISQQLASLDGSGASGISYGSGYLSEGPRMWMQGFGKIAEQDRRGGIDGYDADTLGIAVGIDTQNISENTVVGLALGYGNTEVGSNNATTTNTDIYSYQITLYGEFELDNRIFIDGQLSYVFSDNETTRHNVGGVSGLNANGEFGANQYSARVEAGWNYIRGKTMITPSVFAHYTHYNPDSYTETGAGGASLRVESESINVLELGVGVDASWEYALDDSSVITPEVRAGYRYDVIGDSYEATSNFVGGGAGFGTEGADPAKSTFTLGLGMTYYTNDNWKFSVNYDYEFKSDYTSHSGFLRAGYEF